MHYVYMLRCRDGSLYTGYARDPEKRAATHNRGRGARYTAGRRPVELVFIERYSTISRALRREYEIKQLSRAEKEAIISSTVSPERGSPAEDLIGEVYDELRRLAANYVQREQAKSVQATELVHEAFLRLRKEKTPRWKNRTHFVAIAAISMRRLLVERARARHAAKRGGDQVMVTLDDKLLAAVDQSTVDLVALDRALEGLARLDLQQARIVELRYFGGLSVEETADALSISPATVKRHWTMAKAWLMRELSAG